MWLQTQAPPDGAILTLEEAVALGRDLWGKLRQSAPTSSATP